MAASAKERLMPKLLTEKEVLDLLRRPEIRRMRAQHEAAKRNPQPIHPVIQKALDKLARKNTAA